MPIYKNINGVRKKAKFAFYGSTLLPEIYYGSKKVFEMDGVVFEKDEPGTYTASLPFSGFYEVVLVGGGSGGCYGYTTQYGDAKVGNQGASIIGTIFLNAGNYTTVVGEGGNGAGGPGFQTSGKGTESSFLGNIAGGGDANTALGAQGNGGVATVVTAGLVGDDGEKNDLNGKYLTYGAGGGVDYLKYANPGTNGYVRIKFVGFSQGE